MFLTLSSTRLVKLACFCPRRISGTGTVLCWGRITLNFTSMSEGADEAMHELRALLHFAGVVPDEDRLRIATALHIREPVQNRSVKSAKDVAVEALGLKVVDPLDQFSPQLQEDGMRCGDESWLGTGPLLSHADATELCMLRVLARPDTMCSHEYFVLADKGDMNCACVPPGASCSNTGELYPAKFASTYRIENRSSTDLRANETAQVMRTISELRAKLARKDVEIAKLKASLRS